MKRLLTALFCLICVNSFATNYYFSNGGNDLNSGTSTAAPFATISKFNLIFASKLPGDSFLFKRGDSFYGKMIISRSGTAGNTMTIGAYGTGARPIITGFTTVSAWTNLSGNIWESTSAVSSLSYTNMVAVNGVNVAMGRQPNTGFYYIFQSHVGAPATSLTSTSLNASSINWTGAECVYDLTTYIAARNPITSASASTINITPSAGQNAAPQADGEKFIIQADPRTLDVQNEWYYKPSTHKLQIYSTSSPTGVQIATIDTLVYNNGLDYITFDNLSFQGAGYKAAIWIQNSATNNTIQNCDFNYCGRDGVFVPNSGVQNSLTVTGCTFNNVNNCAINAWYGPGFVTTDVIPNAVISNNTVSNSGLAYGMGGGFTQTGGGGTFQSGIVCNGNNNLIELNTVNNIGYNGITLFGNSTIVQKNFVTNFNLIATDGGGIYTWNSDTLRHSNGAKIINNIVGFSSFGYGIYTDDKSNGIEISGNTCFNCVRGIFAHNTYNSQWLNNTAYNNVYAQFDFYPSTASILTNRITIKNNIFFSRSGTQRAANFNQLERLVGLSSFLADSNYYTRPIDDNLTIDTYYNGVYSLRTLASYKGIVAPQESHSQKAPRTITNVNEIFFCYNPTDHDSTISLAGNYVDCRNVAYPGTITLTSFTSAVLINTGTNIPPIANAGADKNITLPTSSVSQAGSGTDADGTIVSYVWSQVSGPTSVTFGSQTSATTTINSMTVAGTYVFQLRVTDNSGAIGTDNMTVVVNASPPVNVPPTANAGGNKVITLPTNSVTQVGSGTDTDGTIVSYAWIKTSGPATYTIVSPTSATTVINNLVSGTYVFTLTVTDNLGATGTATAQIIVNITPVNQNPIADAGANQTLTWPTNTATVSASGSNDPDGTIVSYVWSKISGPASYGILNAGSSTASIYGLDIGVYQFQLQVTDNVGATATDVMTITQNKGSATITQSGLTTVYNTFPQGITVTTSPAGIATSTTYNGITTQPTLVGTYTVVTGGADPHWTMTTVTNTFNITKATAVINATSQTVNFDGLTHSIVATTTPAGLTLTYLYDGVTSTPPSAIGVHTVHITLVNSNYQATAVDVTITIVSNPAIIFISDTVSVYDGLSHIVTVTSAWPYSLTGSPHTQAGVYFPVTATINDGIHTGSFTATQTITKRPAVLSWVQPAPIPYGTLWSSSQLNATADIQGTWTYSVVLGSKPPIGVTSVVATFVPTDTTNKTGGSITRTISVYAVNPFQNFFITGVDGRIFFIEQ